MSARHQFSVLLAKELRRLLFDPLVLAMTAVLLISIALATIRSADAYKWNLEQFNSLQQPREESQLANISAQAAAAPLPLHILARGAGDIMARPVSIMRQLEASFNIKYTVGLERRQKELIYALVPDADPLTALRYLLAILALLMAYGQVCGERQVGTLRHILANPVARRTVLASKIVAGMLTLAAAVVLAALVILVTLWTVDVSTPVDQLWRLAAILLATYVYGVTFLAIGILVSTCVHSSSAAILTSLIAWCLLVIVTPGLSAQLAEALSPAPPAQQVYMKKLAIERNMKGGEVQRGSAEKLKELNREAWKAVSAADQDFLNQVRRQESLAQIIGLLSPATAYEAIVTTYAGTGIAEEHELLRQLFQHFREVAQYDDIEPVLMARTVPDKLPVFKYRPLSAAALVSASLVQWAALLAIPIVLFGIAFRRFNRYDVR